MSIKNILHFDTHTQFGVSGV